MIIVGSIAKDNDFIVYGYTKNNNYLSFSSNLQYYYASTGVSDINEQLSCKFIKDENYICATINNDCLSLKLYKYQIFSNSSDDTLTIYQNNLNLDMHKISSFGLYDIDKDKADTKLLCRQWINKTTIDCLFLQFSIDFNQCKYNILYGITINEANYFSEKNCFFSQFNSEYLFCCGIMDFIKCYKFNITNF